MKPYLYRDHDSGRLILSAATDSRYLALRPRAQKLYVRIGGNPFLPFRVAHYPTPKCYYTDTFRHRRKRDLHIGTEKLRYGLARLRSANTGDA